MTLVMMTAPLALSWLLLVIIIILRLRWYGHVLRKDDDDWVKHGV